MNKLRRRVEIPVFRIEGNLVSTYQACFRSGSVVMREKFLDDQEINQLVDQSPEDFNLIVEDEHEKRVTMRVNARSCGTEFRLLSCLREIIGDAEEEGLPPDVVSVVDMVRFDEDGNLRVRMTQNENPIDDGYPF